MQVESLAELEVVSFISSCQQLFNIILTKASNDSEGDGLTVNQVKQVIKCALQAVRLTKRAVPDSDSVSRLWKPDSVSLLISAFEECPKFKGSSAATSMLKQLLGAISNVSKSNKKKEKKDKKVNDVVSNVKSTVTLGDAEDASKEEKPKKKPKRKADEGEDGASSTPVIKKKKKVKVDSSA